MNTPGYTEVLLSLSLVVIAVIIARWWKIPAAKEMLFGSVRAFVQLIAVGYVLVYIFDTDSPWLILVVMLVMISVAAWTAANRVKNLKGALIITFTANLIGSGFTLGVMLLLNIIKFEAQYVIPLSGMIISNAMYSSSLSINRLVSDIRSSRLPIETALSLGKTWRQASRCYQQEAAMAGMMSTLNFMKTVGIVALPGAMTGMILGGAEPLDAVLLQIIVAYMLLSATTITSIITVELTVRKFFNSAHQLIRSV